MRDKMAVQEGEKVHRLWDLSGATRIFQLRQRKDYPDVPPISARAFALAK
jgi:hypothetical protein